MDICFVDVCVLCENVFGGVGNGFWFGMLCINVNWLLYCLMMLGFVMFVYCVLFDYVCMCW